MAKAKYTKNSRGRFETKVWDGTFTPDGFKHRIVISSTKSSVALERKVQEHKQALSTGNSIRRSNYLFGEYAKHWLDTKKNLLEINTQAMYTNIIMTHLSFLDEVPLADISNSHFQQAINNASDKPRTCQQIYLTFKQIMRMAESDAYIGSGQLNLILRDISIPKYKRSEKRPLTAMERQSLLEAEFTPMEKAFVFILYGCGLRRGEALALSVFDFNFSEATVTINKAIVFDKNDSVLKNSPKSENGYRTVPLPIYTLDAVRPYVQSLSGSNLFVKNDGKPITKSSYCKMWASIIKKMNTAAVGTESFPIVTDLTAHIFRHNYCTNLCYQVPTISVKKIAQLLGDSEKMVLEVYNHIMEEKEDASTVVNKAMAL